MDFLVMLEEGPPHPPVLARVDSVPVAGGHGRRARDVVTLYGTPTLEALALALAAALESHRVAGYSAGAFRHLGIWPGRGAVGEAAWRDGTSGQFVTRILDIPFAALVDTARGLQDECGPLLRRLVAGLAMPDWPDGTWRAISISIDAMSGPSSASLASAESLLEVFREADGPIYEYEGD
jgi:hypothetical protein